jgi:hypothetical protein
MDDVLAPLTASCENDDCKRPGEEPVTWCELWALYLCHSCRMIRTEAELRQPVTVPPRKLPADSVLQL